MSVNITVNGRYSKSTLKHDLLCDPERVKKEVENERRKMRLQQVRVVSKNMAKKVRNDVEMEKERQLKKMEEIKEQELQLWRQNVLEQQERDFRSAIFQVGTAHRAAQTENSRQAQKRAQELARKRPKDKQLPLKAGKENVLKNANVQTDITGKCYPKPSTPPTRNVSKVSKKKNTDAIEYDSSELEEEFDDQNSITSTEILQSTISSLSDYVELSKPDIPLQSITTTNIRRTAPVSVPEITDTSQNESSMFEVDHSKTKMHANEVVSDKSLRKQKININNNFKSTTEEVLTTPPLAGATKKRFTQISDIIRQQKASEENAKQSTGTALQFRHSREQKPSTNPKSNSTTLSLQQTGTSRRQKSPAKPKSKSPIAPSWQVNTSSLQRSPAGLKSKSPSSVPRQAETSRMQKLPAEPKSPSPISSPPPARTSRMPKPKPRSPISLRQTRTFRMQKSPEKPKSKSPISTSSVPKSPKPKSPTFSRPVSSKGGTNLANKSSASLLSQRSAAARVQFYDYNNKFHKQYEHPQSAVETHDPTTDDLQMNAMEQAEFEEKLRQAKDVEIEGLRQKCNERCQKAIEREQVRRTCEDLTAKLNALSKQRQILQCDNHQFSTLRLGQVDAEKETKRNRAVEDILSRPAIITCPAVTHQQSEPSDNPRTYARDLNLGSALTRDEISLNSSDSCCSILLGYVNGQSKQISDDIKKCNEQTRETDRGKAGKLQNLLTRINRLRDCLIRELEKCSTFTASDKDRIQTMVDSISELRKEHENILVDDSITKREDDLKKKEAILEKKLREFYEIQKAAKKNATEKKPGEEVDDKRVETKKSHKEFGSEGEHEQIKMQPEDKEEEEFVERRQVLAGDKPMEIIIKVRPDTKSKKVKKIPSKSPRRLCTTIQNPSAKKNRKRPTSGRSNESSSTSYRSLPPTIQNNVDKLLKEACKTVQEPSTSGAQQSQGENITIRQRSSNLNPLMAHYVQRLLGMSRTSINALGVNSSDVDTPSSSVVNITSNLSAAETEKLTSSRLEHVQTFIEDNYSFIGELEESLRRSSSADSSLQTLQTIWKKALNEQKSKKKNIVEALQTQKEKPTKSALKKPSKKSKQANQGKPEVLSVDKSTQLTDGCTQRIAELTAMINKVRQEKQKILETTLSSVSESGRNSTEYLDLPDRRNNSEESSSRILDLQSTTEPAPQLEKNKQTGISRDSGISLSRPITVQEIAHSPSEDFRQSQSSTESLSSQVLKSKPPISIARFSPQLVEDVPHELSTIFEVETPATSRVNTSITNIGKEFVPHQEQNEAAEKIAYKKFPTFEEYVRLNQLDMSQFDSEFSMQFEKEFNEFMNLAREGKVNDYQEFTSLNKYFAKSSSGDDREAAEELFASLKLANLSFKKFPTTKEYLNKMGVSTSDLLDSQSLDNVDESRGPFSNSSSTESLMNIEKELKMRNILTRSFRQNAVPENRNSSPSEKNRNKGDMSGISHLPTGGTSSDDHTDNLETELKRLGIEWPSVMKKKTMETQALSESTSSSSVKLRRKPSKSLQTSKTSFQKETHTTHQSMDQTDDGGRQLNLREFLTKELLKRTTTSSSFSFSDDSVASSILRSIIGSMTPPIQQQGSGAAQGLDRQKTSTPMASNSTSFGTGSKSQEGVSSVHFFSGDSRLSSVHLNNSSKGADQNAAKDVISESNHKL